jgi:transcriptional regulator with XRE-family HTH domain
MAQRHQLPTYPSVEVIQRDWALKIRQAREARGMTITQVADALGVRHSTLSRWETFRSNIPDTAKVALAGLYGMHPLDLFSWPTARPPMPKPQPVRKVAA